VNKITLAGSYEKNGIKQMKTGEFQTRLTGFEMQGIFDKKT
jgi:hypothetical protein